MKKDPKFTLEEAWKEIEMLQATNRKIFKELEEERKDREEIRQRYLEANKVTHEREKTIRELQRELTRKNLWIEGLTRALATSQLIIRNLVVEKQEHAVYCTSNYGCSPHPKFDAQFDEATKTWKMAKEDKVSLAT